MKYRVTYTFENPQVIEIDFEDVKAFLGGREQFTEDEVIEVVQTHFGGGQPDISDILVEEVK